MNPWRQIGVVARHEYVEGVVSWSFAFLVLGLPALWFVMGMAGAAVAVVGEARPARIAVVDSTGTLRDAVVEELSAPIEVVEPDDTSPEALTDAVLARDLDAWVALDDQSRATGRLTWHGLARPGQFVERQLRDALWDEAAADVLGDRREAYDALWKSAGVSYVDLDAGDDDTSTDEIAAKTLVMFAGLFVMFLPVLMYPSLIAQSAFKEKEEGIAEVLVCAVPADRLLAGKVIGVGGVAATHLAVWSAPMAVLWLGGPAWLAGVMDTEPDKMTEVFSALPGIDAAPVLLALGVAGYGLVASMLGVLTAAVPSQKILQWINLVVFLVVLPVVPIVSLALDDPHRPFVVGLSYLPPLAPPLMWARYLGGASILEVLAALTLCALTIVWMLRLAGRLYRLELQWRGGWPSPRDLMSAAFGRGPAAR